MWLRCLRVYRPLNEVADPWKWRRHLSTMIDETGFDSLTSPLPQLLPRLDEFLYGPRWRKIPAGQSAALVCSLVEVADMPIAEVRKTVSQGRQILTT